MRLTLTLVLTLAMLLLVGTAQAHKITRIPHRCTSKIAPRLCATHFHRDRTNQIRVRAHASRLVYQWMAERHPSRRSHVLALWIHRQGHAKRLLRAYERSQRASGGFPSDWLRAALCVHKGEGAWNDPNAPYWGGMQMDMSFQASYGPEFLAKYGTADHWPPHDQLLASYRAWKTRGWTPWPNTAAACGLL